MEKSEANSATVWAFLWAVKHHWVTLMSGGAIMVLLTLFERFSRKNVPTWVYIAILIMFALWACYLTWRDSQKERANVSNMGSERRHFLAERLGALLNEAGTVEYGAVSLRSIEGMGKVWRETAYHDRAKNFVKEHYGPEIADRYDNEKSKLLESLLADCYRVENGAGTAKRRIQGEIKEVFFEKEINLETSLIISEDCYFYYWFTVRLYLSNIGAPTSIKHIKFVLKSKGGTHEGVRLPLNGYKIQTDEMIDTLVDIEASNDAPLEHTRNGWACFGVPSIKSSKNDGFVADMQIEIQVIDKTKTPHLLDSLARSEWRENLLHHLPRIEPTRTRYPHGY